MYCSNCGTQLSDDANFCLKCGNPQKQYIQTGGPTWETCEIFYKETTNGILWEAGFFYVEAIGPFGVTEVARSGTFPEFGGPSSSSTIVTDVHKDLISKLLQTGWESTGDRGDNWWSNRFRRKIGARKTEEGNLVDLIMLKPGKSIVETIRAIRSVTHLGLVEARRIAEAPHSVILNNVSKSTALQAQLLFEKVGVVTKIE